MCPLPLRNEKRFCSTRGNWSSDFYKRPTGTPVPVGKEQFCRQASSRWECRFTSRLSDLEGHD